jgi:DnaJ-class molecular chaperone
MDNIDNTPNPDTEDVQVEEATHEADVNKPEAQVGEVCSECSGTGLKSATELCQACEGSGKVV